MYDDYKINSLHIMLPKTGAYVKYYDGKTNWMYFFIEGGDVLGNIILIGTNSTLVLQKRNS